jgi:hypothetical protein
VPQIRRILIHASLILFFFFIQCPLLSLSLSLSLSIYIYIHFAFLLAPLILFVEFARYGWGGGVAFEIY